MQRTTGLASFLLLSLAPAASAQTSCAPASGQRLIIYRAGSLTRAFQPLIASFTCQTGIQVKDVAMGSVDAGRQITAGGQACDLYAPADYLDIDLLIKPAGYANFTIIFAHGRMVWRIRQAGWHQRNCLALQNLVPGPTAFRKP